MKPGYKQTEVGVIPEEWEVKPIADFAYVSSGGTPSREIAAYWGGLIPWVTTSQIDFGTITEADQFITEEGMRNSAAKLLPVGTLLIALYGQGKTRGKVGVLGMAATTNQACASISLHEGISREFIFHFLTSRYEDIRKSSNSGSQENLSGNIIKRTLVISPPLPEQRAIAAALSDVDALLGGLDRLITKKRDLKQAAMQQLLTGQTRLPGFDGAWEVKRLKTIVQIPVTDGPHLTPEFFDDGIPFLSVNNLVGNKIDITDLRFISRQDHELFSRKCKPRKNDILLGKAASVGKVAIVELDFEFNIWSPIALIRISENNAARFVYYQLQSADLISQITLLTNSSSQGNIGMGDIEKLTLSLPPLPEQIAIAAVLSDMDAELVALEQRRTKTRALKQAMMQELLTGRIRLIARGDAENAE